MRQQSTAPEARTVKVSGELDVDNVPARLRESTDWFSSGRETVIDLAGVVRADSAGVALLLEWIRGAHSAGATLAFINAPAQMRAIIDFCALNDVIPLRGASAPASTQPV